MNPLARITANWTLRQWIGATLIALLLVLVAAAIHWREDILRTGLDPRVPFQTYDPPPAPDYARDAAWAFRPEDPARWTSLDPPADVFFVHPTTYDGGRDWNAPIGEPKAERLLQGVMLPNYAGPFARIGRLFAPRYRQASLYAHLTLREDARDARRFAYGDVRDAFRRYMREYNRGRPVVLVGVEQGGTLAARLLREEIAPYPDVVARLAGVYLIDTVVPAAAFGPEAPVPACDRKDRPGCVVAYKAVREGDQDAVKGVLERSLVWGERNTLVELQGREPLCVNPILGAAVEAQAEPRQHVGAANATGLEWGARPAFLSRHVGARCIDGVLHVSQPASSSLRPSGSWAERRKAPGYNLFYGDLEADARSRVASLIRRPDFRQPAPPIDRSITVETAPIHRLP